MNLLFLVGQAAWIPETKPPPDSGPAAVRIYSEKYKHHPRRTTKDILMEFLLDFKCPSGFTPVSSFPNDGLENALF